MPKSDCTAFDALDPFFDVIMEGPTKFVDASTISRPSPTMSSLSFSIISWHDALAAGQAFSAQRQLLTLRD